MPLDGAALRMLLIHDGRCDRRKLSHRSNCSIALVHILSLVLIIEITCSDWSATGTPAIAASCRGIRKPPW